MLYLTLPFIVQASPGAKQLKLLGEVNGEARRGSERPPSPSLPPPLPPSPMLERRVLPVLYKLFAELPGAVPVQFLVVGTAPAQVPIKLNVITGHFRIRFQSKIQTEFTSGSGSHISSGHMMM